MGAIDTKSFKSGNSVAVRFPRGTGLKADLDLTITQEGDEYRIKLKRNPDEERQRVLRLVERLRAIGPVGEIEVRDFDIFPDRPGLYD